MVFSKMADPILETSNISSNLIEESIKLEDYNFNLFKSCLMGDIHEIKSLKEGTLLEEEIEQKTERDNMTFWQKIAAFFRRIKEWFVGNGRKQTIDVKKSLDAAINNLSSNRSIIEANMQKNQGRPYDLLYLKENEIPPVNEVFNSITEDTINNEMDTGNLIKGTGMFTKVGKDSISDTNNHNTEIRERIKQVILNALLTGIDPNKKNSKVDFTRYNKLERKDLIINSKDEFVKAFINRYTELFSGCSIYGGNEGTTLQVSTKFQEIVINRQHEKLIARILNDYNSMSKICDMKIAECDQMINTSKHAAKMRDDKGKNEAGDAQTDKFKYIGLKDGMSYYSIAMGRLVIYYMNFYIKLFNSFLTDSADIALNDSAYMDLNYQKYLVAMESCTYRI